MLAINSVGHSEPTTAEPALDDGWRRTVEGWEHISTWVPRPHVVRAAALHPLQLALLQCGLSLAALWLPHQTKNKQRVKEMTM